MKRYQQLLDMGVFTFNDVKKTVGNKNTANSLMNEYLKKNYIARVKRNLYVALDLKSQQPVVNRFEIGSYITENSYICLHTAFEYHGTYNQVYYDVYVSSKRKFTEFEFNGYKYRCIKSKFDEGVIVPNHNENIRTTNLERTVLDAIDVLNKHISLEELFECLELITFLREEKLKKYLSIYNKNILYQKTGLILECFKDDLKLKENFFQYCQKNIGKSKRYLYDKQKEAPQIYNKKWQLVIPERTPKIAENKGDSIG